MEACTVCSAFSDVQFKLDAEGQAIKSSCFDHVAKSCFVGDVSLYASDGQAGYVVTKDSHFEFRFGGKRRSSFKCVPPVEVCLSCVGESALSEHFKDDDHCEQSSY